MKNIETSLVETIAKSDLSSITADATETGIDLLLDEGVLKDIPVLSTISGLVKTGGAIKDYLYLKKIYRFLGVLKDIPVKERRELIEKLGSNEKERAKSGENILLIIDRLDNVNKPAILGHMFQDYLLEVISKSIFLQLAKSLELFNLELSENLKNFYIGPHNNDLSSADALQSLSTSGLVGMHFGSGTINGGGGGYRKNKLGALFLGYL